MILGSHSSGAQSALVAMKKFVARNDIKLSAMLLFDPVDAVGEPLEEDDEFIETKSVDSNDQNVSSDELFYKHFPPFSQSTTSGIPSSTPKKKPSFLNPPSVINLNKPLQFANYDIP